MSPRIVAVVVTWNRRDLLRRIIDAIDASTHPVDELIVVDNASTDDSVEMVRGLETTVPIRIVELASNTGGAGGFHAGLETAMKRDADLIWLMDDDGLPTPDCLERLLPYADRYDFLGPAVVAEQDNSRLCFPIRIPGSSKVVHDLADVKRAATDGVLEGVVIPFNGVLVTQELVRRIGYVREEFFIWGDDVEYLWRAKKAGARVATIVPAIFEHPATDDLGTPMMFGRTTYNHTPSDLKHYCMVRNNITNLKAYVGPLGVLAFLVKTLWFYVFTRPKPERLTLSARAAWAAARKDFTGHERFLR